MSTTASSKRTAFARTPRSAAAKSAMDKLTTVRLDGKFIEAVKKAQINPDLSTIMAKTSSSLALEVNPNGTTLTEIRSREGETLADESDIKRIMGLNSTLNRERKEALKEEMGPALLANLAAILEEGRTRLGTENLKFSKGFIEVYRSTNVAIQRLQKNRAVISAYESSENSEILVKRALLSFAERSSKAIGDFLIHRAFLPEYQEARKLSSFLRAAHVPFYMFGKLSGDEIKSQVPDFNLVNVVFPSDPTKGFYLTFREVVESMQDFCVGLTDAFSLASCLLEDNCLKHFLNIEDVDDAKSFDNAQALGSKLAGVPILVPIPAALFRESVFFNFVAKNGGRGIAWKAGSTLSPQDNLKFVGTIAKRVQFLSLPNPPAWIGHLGTVFPGFVYERTMKDKDLFVQLKNYVLARQGASPWSSALEFSGWSKTAPTAVQSFVRGLTLATVAAPEGSALKNYIVQELDDFDTHSVDHTLVEIDRDSLARVKERAAALFSKRDTSERILGNSVAISNSLLQRTEKTKARKAGLTERTPSGLATTRVVASLKSKGMIALGERMDAWFRQFLTLEIQGAVAAVFAARLEAMLKAPIVQDRNDRLLFLDGADLEHFVEQGDTEDDEESVPEDNVEINPDDV